MKLQGHSFDSPNVEYCVLPRGKDSVVFTAVAILDYDEFEKLCPEPDPPSVIKPGKGKQANYQDPEYLQSMADRSNKRLAWMVLKSLQATEGLVWDTVDMGDHKTWLNYKKELKEAHFSQTEIQRIENAVYTANSLNEARVQEARENFLHGLEEEEKQRSGLHTDQNSSQSGEPANG